MSVERPGLFVRLTDTALRVSLAIVTAACAYLGAERVVIHARASGREIGLEIGAVLGALASAVGASWALRSVVRISRSHERVCAIAFQMRARLDRCERDHQPQSGMVRSQPGPSGSLQQ